MPAAAERPSMPWWSTVRSSRRGRKISTPSISTTTSAVSSMLPACTRWAPSQRATAAPSAMHTSLMPRARVLVESSHIVAWKREWPRSSSSRARAWLWPKAARVRRPWSASRNSAPYAL